MPFQYKKVLVIGATSGIGEALADRLVNEGSFVLAVGRRKENLNALAEHHGHDKAEAITLDIAKLENIPSFADGVIRDHPDLDCIVLNAGIQRKCDFSDPTSIEIDVINLEFTTNYLSYLALTKAFLPFLQAQKTETALIYVSSALALVPIPRVKVIELYPPAVQTELHDEKHQPDVKNGRAIGIPLDEFTNLELASLTQQAYEGLAKGDEQVPVGFAVNAFNSLETKRQEVFAHLVKAMSGQ